MLSSVLVYGQPRNDEPIAEDFPTTPEDDYGGSKLAGEEAAILMCEAAGIRLVILRPVPIIGEGSRGNVSRLIKAVDRDRFFWIGEGSNRRSFIYVGDVAKAIARSLESSNEAVSRFNVTGEAVTVRMLVEMIENKLNKKSLSFQIPTWAAKAMYHTSFVGSPIPLVNRYRRILAAWLADAVYSGNSIDQQLGFAPETTIEEAIGREVDDYLRNK